ncbi:MAG TPA: ABC transporter substrate-binding protein [Candidatus Binatia bacterium]|nr:ABC transporter substrate-binding protein [Candidatus Binatia bacterium]
MGAKILVYALLALILTTIHLAEAQQPKKATLLGYLSARSSSSESTRIEAFRQVLRELGYVEGKNIIIEYRFAEGKFDRLADLAAELVRLNVEVIVTAGVPPTRAAKQVTTTIPIVMAGGGDPVSTGLVASFARPGGNITGSSDLTVDSITKRLELLKEVVPKASRVAVLLNPANPTNPLQLKETQAVASALGITIVPLEIKGAEDFDQAFVTMKKKRADALVVFSDPMFGFYQKQIANLAMKSRLPAIYGNRYYVEAGGLMSYGSTNPDDHYRRAAIYVDKILKGATPAELPVERPMKLDLVINLKAAKQIGLTIPPNVLARADRIIK